MTTETTRSKIGAEAARLPVDLGILSDTADQIGAALTAIRARLAALEDISPTRVAEKLAGKHEGATR
ncbi:hypothetical protein [Oleomonas cavernae]|uniref:hypothetical protein n=1 Tax=Oleomonas cavernae TaxID=2320859 RepID=UPI000E6C3F0F|nr:hypothetical protein [Oleomonas cavernae]